MSHRRGAGGRGAELQGRVVVLSPHLDDAVLSLGAAIARAARAGADVTIVTVLAGDPASSAAAGRWDARSGFASAGEAARHRREEDRRACAVLGAKPVWLPFGDEQYGRGADDAAIWAELERATGGAEIVLAPGFPLMHEDHVWLSRLILDGSWDARLGLYVEQPYVRWSTDVSPALPDPLAPFLDRSLQWWRPAAGPADRLAKLRACRAYRSQLPQLGPRPVFEIMRSEMSRRGEAVAWL